MSYKLDFVADKDVKPFDEAETHGEVQVFIDPVALMYVVGTEMDWQVTELSQEFVFSNPNIEATCGCGESFTVAQQKT